ncbi:MAG TPA: STAS domain-containing protein [Acidimicrobiales bacterium]|nr:STAS domain-containing protein [Acidimicrobiales bacterium]
MPEPVGGEALCQRLRERIEALGTPGVVICDLTSIQVPDATVIDALARVQLTAQRLGCSVRYRHAHPDVRALLHLAGLSQVLDLDGEIER